MQIEKQKPVHIWVLIQERNSNPIRFICRTSDCPNDKDIAN